jgi:hypothetical protein
MPQSLALGDLNGDGTNDVVVVNAGADTLSVFLSDGMGSLTEAEGSPYGVGVGPSAAALADLDLDGNLDVAVAGRGGAITLLLGDGTGRLILWNTVGLAGELSDVAALDLDGDQWADLIAADRSNDTVTVLLGVGNGDFLPPAGYTVGSTGYDPTALALGDLDGDHRQDVVVANEGFHKISVLKGDGSGGFTMAPGFPMDVGGVWSTVLRDVAVGDVNSDGCPDIVYVDCRYSSESWVGVLLGDGAMGFVEAPDSPHEVGPNTLSVALADLDADGSEDVVAPAAGTGGVAILLGRLDGRVVRVDDPPPQFGVYGRAVGLADIDGDQVTDMVTAHLRLGLLATYLNLP